MKYPALWGALFPVGVLALSTALVLGVPGRLQASIADHTNAPAGMGAAATSTVATSTVASPSTAHSSATRTASTSATPTAAASAVTPSASSADNQSFQTAQYADGSNSAIDRTTHAPFTADAHYSIASIVQDTPALVDGQNVDLVRGRCSVCHATTFISSQPPLPASVWHDEVYKMKQKYGATFISDADADKIIGYLSAHYTPETRTVATTAPSRSTARTAASMPVASSAVDGAQIFAANCAACHGASGTGVPGAFPPLAGNAAVSGPDTYVADVLLYGLQGQLSVKGQGYSGAMPAWASQLNDAQIAGVATYVRHSWGNAGAALPAATVKARRATPKSPAQVRAERPQ